MGRIQECDDESEYWMLTQGRWEHNLRTALAGKRGQEALRFLEAALLALPDKRLIKDWLATPTGEVCLVGAYAAAKLAQAEGIPAEVAAKQIAAEQDCDWAEVQHFEDGRWGVPWTMGSMCGVDYDQDDGETITVNAGVQAGLVKTLVYRLVWLNDDDCGKMSPEARYEYALSWVRRRQIKVPA